MIVLSGIAFLPSIGGARCSFPDLPPFGVTSHLTWPDYTPAQRVRMLDDLRAAGVEWIRIDVYWRVLEPVPGERAPSVVALTDEVVDLARARGMAVMVNLGSTPPWAASGRPTDPPADPAAYGTIARWAAVHFAGRVAAWGVYNSPNLHGWSPRAYATVLRAAYPAIKAGDPDALVVAGNLATNDAAWVAGLYEAGARGAFDVLATHAYQSPRNLPPEAANVGVRWRIAHVAAVRRVMVEDGDARTPIWFTEFGWSSHPNDGSERPWAVGVTREEQADYAVRAFLYVAHEFPYVTAMFWYNDRDKSLGNVQEDNYGLVTRDLSPKPVYRALTQLFSTAAVTTSSDARQLTSASGGRPC